MLIDQCDHNHEQGTTLDRNTGSVNSQNNDENQDVSTMVCVTRSFS